MSRVSRFHRRTMVCRRHMNRMCSGDAPTCFVNKQNLSDWSMTPLQHQQGIVTPNGLFFERHHAGVPDINPDTHRLVIHGLVKQPLEFTMDDLVRYPSVSRFYFLECSGNTLTDWLKASSTTVQQTHGLLAGAQWTGIPVSWLLDEAGLQAGSEVGAVRRRGRLGAHALDPDREGARRRPARLRSERRAAARRKWLSAARVHSGLGGQRERQVAATHQGIGPALALPQRNRAVHRPLARRQVASVQLRHGVQIGDHPALRRHEASGPGSCTKFRASHGQATGASRRST